MSRTHSIVSLDVGEARIGVAVADTAVRIAVPFDTIETVDGDVLTKIGAIVVGEQADVLVVGYPRNQSGEPTAQTRYVEEFTNGLREYCDRLDYDVAIEFQDESLTSVAAEQRLKARGKRYDKGEIDREAAAIILQDYLELHT